MINLTNRINELWAKNAPAICEDLGIEVPNMEIVYTNERFSGLCEYYVMRNMFGGIASIGNIKGILLNINAIKLALLHFVGARNEIVDSYILYVMRHELRHAYQVKHTPEILIEQDKQKMIHMIFNKSEGAMVAEADADRYALFLFTDNELDNLVTRLCVIAHNEMTKETIKEYEEIMKRLREITITPKVKAIAKATVIGATIGLAIGLLFGRKKK